MFATSNNAAVKNTTHKVVVPFYSYAAFTLLASTLLLFFSSASFTGHYFHPHILAITHAMALGWGTMIILGASHQLIPVLTESRLYSIPLAYVSFAAAATGIPFLLYGLYVFNMGWPARWGGALIVFSILCYLINIAGTITKNKTENVHAVFVFSAALWLLLTTGLGLALVYNFSYPVFSKDSLAYLPLHAHMGIVGWFLLLVIGVGSRLIPMFLISKYSNPRLLWLIFILINAGLLIFLLLFLFNPTATFYLIPIITVLAAIVLFGFYCFQCYQQRIRRQVDEPMKTSLLAILLMLLPLLVLFIIMGILVQNSLETRLVLVYGFVIFFGWITAIILGMTFKTLPFIVWNKVYHQKAGLGKTPNPKDLYSNKLFKAMVINYGAGFILFIAGVLAVQILLLQTGAVFLIAAAVLYNYNVINLLLHKSPTT